MGREAGVGATPKRGKTLRCLLLPALPGASLLLHSSPAMRWGNGDGSALAMAMQQGKGGGRVASLVFLVLVRPWEKKSKGRAGQVRSGLGWGLHCISVVGLSVGGAMRDVFKGRWSL